ncbi:Alkaline phosphatase 4 precursor [Limihaloglobus sulfuriphilus]|uniref:Alkaline phosphatase 4 n=1 Tax=Limihaloglobus sulfuriphilus TaxID=1851148 RepID=A0A1Q2MEW8_9BACT|nr:alkaline phosphatase [Limihaloglobus sulfuriphilus]AQQ71088.1 Alkaline phosphatase 4 precursor [Limihaloglobus sulfuriphilus]
MKKKTLLSIMIILMVVFTSTNVEARRTRPTQGPKYVFYFIGDGMALPQIHATEAYLAQSAMPDNPTGNPGGLTGYSTGEPDANLLASMDTAGAAKLVMSQFPVLGLQTTYANNRFITGSAASATALSCGEKTTINTIAMDKFKALPFNTIAEKAQAKGMKVGVVSSVSIDHATPACFYAHQPERGLYWDISNNLSDSGFDYFAGGGMKGERIRDGKRYYAPGRPDADASNDPVEYAKTNGYTVASNAAELAAVAPGTKCFAYSKDYIDGSWALPYEMDRDPADLSLADYTAEGIRLMDNSNGFFMMVEAGKLDWACHANDAVAAIKDNIALDDAVAVAVDFYQQHPTETLIVVTGDHECGGMTLGFAGTGYETAFEILDGQTMSYEVFDWTEFAAHKASFGSYETWDPAINMNDDIKARIQNAFGLVYDDLSLFEVSTLEQAYDDSMSGKEIAGGTNDSLLYGYYEPFTVTLTHIMNRRAGIAFTSYSHTAVPVPVYALGYDAWRFAGNYDNTDVALKMAQAMRVNLGN